jgi:uncharacterized protein
MANLHTALRECHRLRKHLRELQAEIDRGPRLLKNQQARLATAEAAHKEHYDTIKQLKLKLKEDEGSLKTIETHLGKLYTRSMEVTTMKEMDATRHETEIANGKKGTLEDAILTGMGEIEERTAAIPTVEKTWADAQADFKQYGIDAAERLERMQMDQKASQAKLIEHEATLPEEVKTAYDRNVKAQGPDALAGLVGRVCQHCRGSITEQQRNDATAGRFITCPSCYRILYVSE